MVTVRSFVFYLLSSFFVPLCFAEQSLELSSQKGFTSDRIWLNQSTLHYSSSRRDALWAYPEQDSEDLAYQARVRHQEFLGPALSFIAQDASLGFDHFFAPDHRLTLFAGLSQIQQRSVDSWERGLFVAHYQKSWDQNQFLEIQTQRGFLLPLLVPLAGNPNDFYGLSLQGRLLRRFAESFEASLRYSLMNLDVQNHLQKYDVQLMYAISRFPRWFLIGIGGEQMSWQRTSTSYWSPRVFRSLGPRLDINLPLTGQWNLFLGGSYNFFRENAFTPGQGFYGRGGLTWGQRGAILVHLFYEKIQSTQNGNLWQQDSGGFSLEYLW